MGARRSSVQKNDMLFSVTTCKADMQTREMLEVAPRYEVKCTTPHPKDVGKVVAEAVSDLEHVLSSLCFLPEQTVHSSSQSLQFLPPPPADTSQVNTLTLTPAPTYMQSPYRRAIPASDKLDQPNLASECSNPHHTM